MATFPWKIKFKIKAIPNKQLYTCTYRLEIVPQNFSSRLKKNDDIYKYLLFLIETIHYFITACRNFRKKIRMGWIELTFAGHAITTYRWRLFVMGALCNDRLRRRPLGMSGDIQRFYNTRCLNQPTGSISCQR